MLNNHLKAFLEMKAEELSKPVRKFMNVAAVYEGEYDDELYVQCRSVCRAAEQAVTEWLRLVLLVEQAEQREARIRIKLTLADMKVRLEISNDMFSDTFSSNTSVMDTFETSQPFFSGVQRVSNFTSWDNGSSNEVILTPVGKLDLFTYKVITEMKGNPVELFYGHLASQLDKLHKKCGQGLLNETTLSEHHICDILCVYKMDLLWRDLKAFFEVGV